MHRPNRHQDPGASKNTKKTVAHVQYPYIQQIWPRSYAMPLACKRLGLQKHHWLPETVKHRQARRLGFLCCAEPLCTAQPPFKLEPKVAHLRYFVLLKRPTSRLVKKKFVLHTVPPLPASKEPLACAAYNLTRLQARSPLLVRHTI